MKKNRREARKNKRPFRLPIRLCKPNGKHIIRNKTQRHKDNSSVFVWRCLLLTLNWKSHKVMGGNRANSAIFVQVISYTYLRSLRPERAQTEKKKIKEKGEIGAVCVVVVTKEESNEK